MSRAKSKNKDESGGRVRIVPRLAPRESLKSRPRRSGFFAYVTIPSGAGKKRFPPHRARIRCPPYGSSGTQWQSDDRQASARIVSGHCPPIPSGTQWCVHYRPVGKRRGGGHCPPSGGVSFLSCHKKDTKEGPSGETLSVTLPRAKPLSPENPTGRALGGDYTLFRW